MAAVWAQLAVGCEGLAFQEMSGSSSAPAAAAVLQILKKRRLLPLQRVVSAGRMDLGDLAGPGGSTAAASSN